MKKILILDANSLLNRAFYGVRPLSTSSGLPTNAVFGYINILKKHLDAQKPDFAVACFDVHAPTFRHIMDASYKANRKPMPDELKAQLPYLRRATEGLGFTILEKEGYEADDLIGTLSQSAAEDGMEAILVTGDRDSYQLVSDRITLILAGTQKDEIITPEVLSEKFALEPHQLIDVKALAGDTSDNIPGVRGIGEKTAVKLICENGSLDGVYQNLDRLSVGPSAKEKLRLGKDDAYRSRQLAEICREVPQIGTAADYPWLGLQEEHLRPLLVELEFFKLLKTLFPEEKEPDSPQNTDHLQASIFDLEEENNNVEIEEIDASSLSDKNPLIAVFDKSFYVLFEGKPYRLVGETGAYLRSVEPIVCDYKSYLHAFHDVFGDFKNVKVSLDLFLAAYVINSHDNAMTISRLALIYLKKVASRNADSDPSETLLLMKDLAPVVHEALEQSSVRDLYYETELPLSYVLAKMELRGFCVSEDGIREYGEKLRLTAEALQTEIYRLAGEEFAIHSPKQLGIILFEKLGLPAGKKTKTGYATDAETLGKLRFYSPIIDLVLHYRTVTKLKSTYVDSLLEKVAPDGRIRTVFNQMLTATGRLSSAEPNLQNIPVKTELGREMRKFFVAEDGHLLIDADYSQIELRLLAHISEDEALCQAFRDGVDIHTRTAGEIFHVPQEEVTKEMRKSAKAVNFGIVYGIGEYSLSQDLGIPRYLAKEYIDRYFSLYPKVKSYLDRIRQTAHENGWVETLFGRKRNIPELKSPKKNLVAFGERVAMNAPIQGTAADIIKIAMVRVDRRLEEEGLATALVLQVHDELILEAPKNEAEYAAKLLREEMEKVGDFLVPLTAEAASGANWLDAK